MKGKAGDSLHSANAIQSMNLDSTAPLPWASGNAPNAGFTRAEFFVVMGLVAMPAAVLAALLVTSLRGVKESTGRIECQNNLAKIGLAMGQFGQDHEQMYPKDWTNDRTTPPATPDEQSPTGAWCNQGFDAALLPYVKTRSVFMCPGDIWLKANVATGGARNNWDDTSYGINHMVQNRRQDRVGNPPETILLGHTRFEHTLFEDRRSVLWDTHQNGNNYLFCDGHVAFLNGTATLKPKNLWLP